MISLSIAFARSILATGVLVALAGSAGAQHVYPNRPVRMVTPFAPGGSTSNVARLLGQKLTESWGQQVIVDNRPGGNTIIGTDAVAKSPADGYTLLLMTSTHVTIPLLYRNVPFDAIKDFAPVATVVSTENILVVHPSVPAKNLHEFIALAKSRPGQLNYGSPSTGGATHLVSELFNIMAEVKMQHIPYKGGAPALADLVGGQIQVSFQSPINAAALIKSGKLRAIAISGESRSPALPQVPTFTESGLPNVDMRLWYGVLAPAGTAQVIIGKLSTEIARILGLRDVQEKLGVQGLDPFISSHEQFAALLKADMARYARIIKTADIRLDN